MENKFKIKLPFMKNSLAAKRSAAAHKSRLGKDPYFDWTIILAFFIGMSALSVCFAFSLWNSVLQGPVDSVTNLSNGTQGGITLHTTNLQKIITLESQKSATASQYEQAYVGPSDPAH